MQITKRYKIKDSKIAPTESKEKAEEYAKYFGVKNPEIIEIETSYLEDGDKIIISYHFGGSEDADGVTHGGEWMDVIGMYQAFPEDPASGRFITIDGKFLTCMGSNMEYNGYPYKNIRMCVTTEEMVLDSTEQHYTEENEIQIKIDDIEKEFEKAEYITGEKITVDGERIEHPVYPQNIYGSGQWWIIQNNWIWHIQNNGMDGDDWGKNNVNTGGAGAIGVRVPFSDELAEKIRSLV
jgi:hypothetical protein